MGPWKQPKKIDLCTLGLQYSEANKRQLQTVVMITGSRLDDDSYSMATLLTKTSYDINRTSDVYNSDSYIKEKPV